MTTIKREVYEVLPIGEYEVSIDSAVLGDGKFGPQVELTLSVMEQEHQGVTLKMWTAAKFSDRSKLFRLARAAFGGKEIPKDYDLELDHLVGKNIIATVLVKAKDDGSKFNKVDEVAPVDGWPEPAHINPNDNAKKDHVPF